MKTCGAWWVRACVYWCTLAIAMSSPSFCRPSERSMTIRLAPPRLPAPSITPRAASNPALIEVPPAGVPYVAIAAVTITKLPESVVRTCASELNLTMPTLVIVSLSTNWYAIVLAKFSTCARGRSGPTAGERSASIPAPSEWACRARMIKLGWGERYGGGMQPKSPRAPVEARLSADARCLDRPGSIEDQHDIEVGCRAGRRVRRRWWLQRRWRREWRRLARALAGASTRDGARRHDAIAVRGMRTTSQPLQFATGCWYVVDHVASHRSVACLTESSANVTDTTIGAVRAQCAVLRKVRTRAAVVAPPVRGINARLRACGAT